jgi:hypothetical protein
LTEPTSSHGLQDSPRGTPDQPMSRAERSEFATFTKQYARSLKARGEEHAAVLLEVFEEELAREWGPKEEQWSEVVEMAQKAVADANARIREYFEERGLSLKRAPELKLYWGARGENSERERREELRKVARAQAEVVKKRAVAEGERIALDIQQQILVGDFSRADARALVFGLPKMEELMPPLQFEQVLAVAQGRDRNRSRWEGRMWPELGKGDDDEDGDPLGETPF